MADIKFDGNSMSIPGNIKRGNPIPLDSTSVYYPDMPDANGEYNTALQNAQLYAGKIGGVAYVGQIITVCEGEFVNGEFVPNMAHENSGIYYIADKTGKLVKLVNNSVYTDDKKEDLEVDYSKIVITKTEEGVFTSAIIIAQKPFKKGTSDLFINGIKYNNSEYTEILVEGKTDICDGIKFTAFEVIPHKEKDGVVEVVGDEITIMADYE